MFIRRLKSPVQAFAIAVRNNAIPDSNISYTLRDLADTTRVIAVIVSNISVIVRVIAEVVGNTAVIVRVTADIVSDIAIVVRVIADIISVTAHGDSSGILAVGVQNFEPLHIILRRFHRFILLAPAFFSLVYFALGG